MSPSGLFAVRDFRLLFTGRCVSLLGDGVFLVALAWQAYTLSNAPTALSMLGIAMTVPLIGLLLFGGVVSDSHRRRRVMLAADAVRALALALLAALAAAGVLALWQMVVIVAVYGGAQAFFDPASDAILPEVVAEHQLGSANALEQVVRPLALRLAGPALGGVLIGLLGIGAAFALDAGTFVVSAATLWRMSSDARALPAHAEPGAALAPGGSRAVGRAGESGALAHVRESGALAQVRESSTLAQVREGYAYVRGRVWLWGTFVSAGIAYLLFMGPAEVLLQFVVKHELHGSSLQLGLVLGAGGLGSVASGLAMTRSGLPAKGITFIFLTWTLATLAVAGYGLAAAVWELMLASVAFNLLESAGEIVWATMKQRHVPVHMLGRVSSLDWLISVGLLPLSFALTAPLSALLGVRATLVCAGLAGASVTFAGLLLPGMRAVERSLPAHPAPASL